MQQRKISNGQIISLLAGNILEHYDSALFGLLSPILAPLFFPSQDPLVSLMMTYALIPLGFLSKPLGALFFGHLCDKIGRRQSLLFSLFGMSLTTVAFALIPTYQEAGAMAPALLIILRILQSFFASGENIGGAILLLERTPLERHNLLSSLWSSATIGGIILASFAVTCISCLAEEGQHWRALYLLGSITALAGLILRFSIPAEDEIPKKEAKAPCFKESMHALVSHRKELIMIALASGFSYSTYTVALVMINGFIPIVSPISYTSIMKMNSALLILDLVLLPLSGLLASKFSKEKMMMASVLAATFLGVPLFMLLEGASYMLIVFIRVLFVVIGVFFSANFHSWSQHLVPKTNRGIIISFGYSLGSQLLGAPPASLSLWLYSKTQSLAFASGYWVILAFFCLIAFSKMFEVFIKPPSFSTETT
ncbi:MFS transporter [Estrella lausannensis]|uniref:Proline/betaine transporter n=1 Tax=Estrella lausannensis TaxID=483423 RepID=A0A0H5DTZ5_9BACT|nr:MFS transporter [Estrella lausannensis]CRX39369.1 proline/betaine transporter [Estrella lausannensis]